MAFILNIETATSLCSVALAQDGKVLELRETYEEKSHASSLTVFIDEILTAGNITIQDLDAIAVGKGPGSYTGLRIGVSTAKGLCYGAEIPLIAVNTLQILFRQAVNDIKSIINRNADTLFCPMIDARRMEVFTCIFDSSGKEIEPITAKIVDSEVFQKILTDHTILFFGSGMEKCRSMLEHPNASFLPDIHPHSFALAQIAEESFIRQDFENIAYFEPFYLKDFIATVSKKGLHV